MKTKDFWYTPYVCQSASEYHAYSIPDYDLLITQISFLIALVGLIDLFFIRIYLFFWACVAAAFIFYKIGGAINNLIVENRRKKPLSSYSDSYIQKKRKEYLDNMIKEYGPEMGAILQEIARKEGRHLR